MERQGASPAGYLCLGRNALTGLVKGSQDHSLRHLRAGAAPSSLLKDKVKSSSSLILMDSDTELETEVERSTHMRTCFFIRLCFRSRYLHFHHEQQSSTHIAPTTTFYCRCTDARFRSAIWSHHSDSRVRAFKFLVRQEYHGIRVTIAAYCVLAQHISYLRRTEALDMLTKDSNSPSRSLKWRLESPESVFPLRLRNAVSLAGFLTRGRTSEDRYLLLWLSLIKVCSELIHNHHETQAYGR